jgi:tetratricopeptide (TPR) repeat protein
MKILSATLLAAACLSAQLTHAQAGPGVMRAPAQAGCMCNENSFSQTPCARRGAPRPGRRELRARREIQARIDQTVAADKAENVEAAFRYNTPDFTAKTHDGKVLTAQQVRAGIQANYNYIISISDRTRVRIDCLTLRGDEATVYINQHFVRTVPMAPNRTPRELVTNVTHRELWVRTGRGWMRRHIEELQPGPFFVDGKRMNPNKPFDPEAPPYDPADPHPKKSGADALLATITEKGIEPALRQYHALKSSADYYLTELELNGLGYKLLAMQKVGEAVEIFKLNVAAYPQSSNVYDSLGEAYMKAGDREQAIRNYRRSLELDPRNTNAVEMLKKLGAG